MLERGAFPLFLDMRGADWTDPDAFRLADGARRFENWEFAYALVAGLGAAARLAPPPGAGRPAGGFPRPPPPGPPLPGLSGVRVVGTRQGGSCQAICGVGV